MKCIFLVCINIIALVAIITKINTRKFKVALLNYNYVLKLFSLVFFKAHRVIPQNLFQCFPFS